jgi:hypothetical protein
MSKPFDLRNFAAFAAAMREVRRDFPQHSAEIDRAIYDVGQKVQSCDDPNCTCSMTFENFRAASNRHFGTEENAP